MITIYSMSRSVEYTGALEAPSTTARDSVLGHHVTRISLFSCFPSSFYLLPLLILTSFFILCLLSSCRERLLSEHSDDATRRKKMNEINPKYILRNHMAHTAIEKAKGGDYSEVSSLLHLLQRPFDEV